jgi:hypothetical protein
MPNKIQEASRTPNNPDQNRNTSLHIIIKMTSTDTRERILKAVKENKQIPYKNKPIKITADFNRNIKSKKSMA